MPPKKSAHARGLGYAHRQNRTRLLNALRDGAPCWWCGQPMHRDASQNFDRQPLEADHSLARAHGGHRADRMLHSTCNRSRGDGTRDDQRPALTGLPAPTSDHAGDLRVMAWPW